MLLSEKAHCANRRQSHVPAQPLVAAPTWGQGQGPGSSSMVGTGEFWATCPAGSQGLRHDSGS